MKLESIILILAIIIFIIFYILAIVYKNKPISDYIITGGIGAILAGTFFGIMKDSILNQKNNTSLNLYIIIFFFVWYISTKMLSYAIKNNSVEHPSSIQVTSNENENENIDQNEDENENKKVKVTEKENFKEKQNWREGLSKSLISFIIVFIIVILGISFYKGGDDNSHFFMYNVLITVIISLAVLFAFFSGNRINYQHKIEILSYTFSYGIVFGIIAPIFLFQSFSFRNSVTMTIIFFIWLSITFSMSNFLNTKKEYIKRV
jgi:ABC-type transport system involved in multi-copper enzyme maturation permease subunit